MDYASLLQRSFLVEREQAECPPESRLEYLSQHVFDFTTYESSVDELFARKAVEVCDAITSRKTFEYIATNDGRIWYLLMCNMPFFAGRLEWGTSIRGAWWSEPHRGKLSLDSCGLWLEDGQQSGPLDFSREEWEDFVRALVAFAAPEMGAPCDDGFESLPEV